MRSTSAARLSSRSASMAFATCSTVSRTSSNRRMPSPVCTLAIALARRPSRTSSISGIAISSRHDRSAVSAGATRAYSSGYESASDTSS
jgi:hypothetical protein